MKIAKTTLGLDPDEPLILLDAGDGAGATAVTVRMVNSGNQWKY